MTLGTIIPISLRPAWSSRRRFPAPRTSTGLGAQRVAQRRAALDRDDEPDRRSGRAAVATCSGRCGTVRSPAPAGTCAAGRGPGAGSRESAGAEAHAERRMPCSRRWSIKGRSEGSRLLARLAGVCGRRDRHHSSSDSARPGPSGAHLVHTRARSHGRRRETLRRVLAGQPRSRTTPRRSGGCRAHVYDI